MTAAVTAGASRSSPSQKAADFGYATALAQLAKSAEPGSVASEHVGETLRQPVERRNLRTSTRLSEWLSISRL